MGEVFFKRVFLLFLFICISFLIIGLVNNSNNHDVVRSEDDVSGNVILSDSVSGDLITGFVVHPLYPSFSAAEKGFVFNNNSKVVSVSDDAVYKTGYYSINGSGWTSFSLTGSAYGTSTVWLTGVATKTLPTFGVGEHYIIIYSCKYITASASWDCYGNRWQLIIINNTPAPVPVATCSDKIKNQGETGVDCGGPCAACPCVISCSGKQCGSDGCTGTCGTCSNAHGSTLCTTSGLCQPTCAASYASCDSNNVNGCETQLGTITNCASCGNVCASGQTCTNNVCTTVQTATCSDGKQNQGETGVDCGGPCSACSNPTNYLRTFYVSSSSGSDANNGTSSSSPWKTISKVNSQTFKAGDGILFKKGDTWYESLIVSSSGSSTAPITYGAYGTGNNPLISGFTTITGWTETSPGSGIYQSSCPACTSALNLVTMNGIPKALGRWPNTGYSIFESHSGSTSITDNQLTGTPNWAGAQIVVRTTRWTLDKSAISGHSGNTLTFSSVTHEPRNNYGYFIQKSEKTLDQLGEWYFDSSANKLKMYFGTNNPSSYTVKAANIETLVTISAKNYITFDHISFEGANSAIFSLPNAGHITIQNCDLSYSGKNAVYMYITSNLKIENSNINYALNNGIDSKDGASPNALIKSNLFDNNGKLAGMGESGTGNYITIVNWGSDSLTVDSNKITNSGSSGINFAGSSNIIKNNIIDTYCTVIDDGGGIYSSYSSYYSDNYLVSKVQDNIVLNGIGNGEGTDDPTYLQAQGIYMDDTSDGFEIFGNTAINCADSGLFIQYTDNDINVHDNTFFNNRRQMLVLGGAKNLNIKNNIFFSKIASQLCVGYDLDGIASLGSIDYNYYARPIDDTNTFGLLWSSPRYTLAQWQSMYGLDLHSKKSPKSITSVNDILFEYNPTTTNKVVALSGNYVDVKGAAYSGSVTLKPFASIVLIKN